MIGMIMRVKGGGLIKVWVCVYEVVSRNEVSDRSNNTCMKKTETKKAHN